MAGALVTAWRCWLRAIVPLQQSHWEAAAALVAARVGALRSRLPMLPAQYEQAATIYPLLAELAAHAPGVAALEHGELVGFLTAMSLPAVKGKRAAFSPEWANAAVVDDLILLGRNIYQALYAALAPAWLANGCYVHALRVLANDQSGLDGLHWQGFGLNNVDAMRDLTPVFLATPNLHPEIRQATVADIDAIMALGEGLQRHLAAPPIYLPLQQLDSRADHLAWLAQPGHVQWLAFLGDEPVAELRLEPSNYTACAIAADAGTTFITSAYTVPAARKGGVAAALLNHALAAARASGYVRIATDFESANIPGAAFWLRHFQPMAFTALRYVDERAGYAHAERRLADFW